ncbi:MAG TPA: dTDP-glucose 4,6-dehydratase [Steroidobacteraceae bacterium]|jgi:dTDP-glucose 4,6-dehydratase|nr:dTDP-glucose 4,6-dehydratase [Steroidobacteraceae bacterium]
MKFEPRNVFITGGAGFIGANFVRYWLENTRTGHVIIFDALTYAGNMQNLSGLERNPRYVFVKGDICDEETVRALFMRYEIDTLVHFAAESHVDRSILGPDEFIRTNITGTHSLLKVAKALWIDQKVVRGHRFHHVSTDEVYGSLGPHDPPFHEATPYAPNSPYSASKAASDHLVRAYHETYGLSTTVTNCSNNYGPFQFPEKLIPLTIVNILIDKPLPVYGDGLQIRDWLHVADHCEAIALALRKDTSSEVYNVGGNGETTNLCIVNALCELVDAHLGAFPKLRSVFPAAPAYNGKRAADLIRHVRDRLGHDRRYAIDYTKAARDLGYIPARDLRSGLAQTVEWYLNNFKWWRPLLAQSR